MFKPNEYCKWLKLKKIKTHLVSRVYFLRNNLSKADSKYAEEEFLDENKQTE